MLGSLIKAGGINVVNFFIDHIFILIPAFLLSGAIGSLVNKFKILKYMGPESNKFVSYSFASVVGICLSVCACGIVPLFSGIYISGAGLGPAITFLFSGPAINITAITLTFLLLGAKMGVVRIIVTFIGAYLIGFLFSLFFEKNKPVLDKEPKPIEDNNRKWWQTFSVFALLFTFTFLPASKISNTLKWNLYLINFILLCIVSYLFLNKTEIKKWLKSTWHFFSKIALPMVIGVFMIGVLETYFNADRSTILFWVTGNTWTANFIASLAAALMYFGSCVSVPFVAGLVAMGLHQGPALTLLLAGPAVSLPTFFAIRKIMGIKRASSYLAMVIIFSMIVGKLYGDYYTVIFPFLK
ncbi:MAG: permease [Candidatus Muirbacterium halophilum]|nr:permease [Candidatus Muirbacterium halophilum]MCK9474514.1 permease [Candidatus Muirbacterium halophilum]